MTTNEKFLLTVIMVISGLLILVLVALHDAKKIRLGEIENVNLGPVKTLEVTGNNKEIVSINHLGSNTYVTVITLEDGTKCATMLGYQAVSIDCDWKK